MREVSFLHQNSRKWKEFEQLMSDKEGTKDPNRLTDLFVELTDDLSYARTFFPQAQTTAYLNSLSVKVHQKLYRNKKERASRLITFWTQEVPRVMRETHRMLLLSFCIFILSAAIGVFSMNVDGRFARLVLGDGYVNMTEHNIEKGNALEVYQHSDGFTMFVMIAFNNEMVALRTFIMGLMAGFGTVMVLFNNGLMVGVFQYFFVKANVGAEAARGIWLHGTLEISSIVIAGSAGLVLGHSILFPGTYKRLEAFRRGAIKGLKIMVGQVPQILLAAVFESFVTRWSQSQVVLSWTIIALSLLFVIWYYVIYPIQCEKRALA